MSQSKTFDGIIYRLYNSGASDKVVVVIAKNGSRIVLLAKGARKSSSRKSSSLEMGNYVKGNLIEGYAIPILSEVNKINEYSNWKKSVVGSVALQFMCEIMDKFCIEESEDIDLFNTFHDTLNSYSEDRMKMLLSIFSLKILALSGHTPESAQIDMMDKGNLSERLIKTQKFILNSPINIALKVNLTDSEQEKMLQLHVNLIEEVLEYPLKSKIILFNILAHN